MASRCRTARLMGQPPITAMAVITSSKVRKLKRSQLNGWRGRLVDSLGAGTIGSVYRIAERFRLESFDSPVKRVVQPTLPKSPESIWLFSRRGNVRFMRSACSFLHRFRSYTAMK
jgi:hypothetical protein